MKAIPIASVMRTALKRLQWVSLTLGLLTALVLFAAQQFLYELHDSQADAQSNAQALLTVAHVAQQQQPAADAQAWLAQAARGFDRVTAVQYCHAGQCLSSTGGSAAPCEEGWNWEALCVRQASSHNPAENLTLRYTLQPDHLSTARDIAFFALILGLSMGVAHAGSRRLRARARSAEQDLRKAASHDPLTGLMNRAGFETQVDARAEPQGVLMVLELDGFKDINDQYGHRAGDGALCVIAERLIEALPAPHLACRLDGGKFGVFFGGKGRQDADRLAAELTRRLMRSIVVDSRALSVGVHAGAAECRGEHDSFEELLRRADVALFELKRRGGQGIQHFDAQMDATAREHFELQSELKRAIGFGFEPLVLHYQPQVDALGRLGGVEALVRWRHSVKGLLQPEQFIPVAEESDVIIEMGLKVIDIACSDLVLARETGIQLHYVSLNISPRQLADPQLESRLLGVLGRHGLGPRDLELELTESSLNRFDGDDSIVHKLSRLGFRIAIDDFGTGHSSLSGLYRMPVHKLKIDGGFVQQLSDPKRGTVIAESIIALADRMKLKTVAEGVETQEQADWLCAAGCTMMQGFLFARPMPFAQLLNWAEARGDLKSAGTPTWAETKPFAEVE